MNELKYPLRIRVKEIIEGRYPSGKKPLLWDERKDGNDVLLDSDDNKLVLYSTGDQSTPAPGWELLLTSYNDQKKGSEWTLYGIPKKDESMQ